MGEIGGRDNGKKNATKKIYPMDSVFLYTVIEYNSMVNNIVLPKLDSKRRDKSGRNGDKLFESSDILPLDKATSFRESNSCLTIGDICQPQAEDTKSTEYVFELYQ